MKERTCNKHSEDACQEEAGGGGGHGALPSPFPRDILKFEFLGLKVHFET